MKINEAGVSSLSVRYIFTPSSFAERIFYYPTRIGHYFCDCRYHFSYQNDIAVQPGHRHNYMIFFAKEGKMEITIDGERSVLSDRKTAVFDCQKPYEYHALTDDTQFYWLLFYGGQSTLFYEQLLQIHEQHVFTAGDSMQMELLFNRLIHISESAQRTSEHLYSELIYSMLCQMLVSEYGAEDDFSIIIEKAVSYMDMNYNKILTIDDVASHVGLSTSYFSKHFRTRTGYPPYEYLTLQRIHRAKELLISTNLTVQQIGYETGYNSEDNFIRSFKKKVGVSPNVFRKIPI